MTCVIFLPCLVFPLRIQEIDDFIEISYSGHVTILSLLDNDLEEQFLIDVIFIKKKKHKDIESSISRNLNTCKHNFFALIAKCTEKIFAKLKSRENKEEYGKEVGRWGLRRTRLEMLYLF